MKKSAKSAQTPIAAEATKSTSKKTAVTKKISAKKVVASTAKSSGPAKKVPVKKAAAAKKATPAKKAVVKKAVVKKPVGRKKSVVPPTVISAQIDVGFGHALFMRGEGPGLSWDSGAPLNCVADDLWSISLKGATSPIIFKFLVDDLSWNTGEDYVVTPGSEVTVVPRF